MRKSRIVIKKEHEVAEGKKWLKQNKSKVKKLMDTCRWLRDNEQFSQCDKYDWDIFIEDCKQDFLSTTVGIMQNIEFAEAETVTQLFNHQLNTLNEQKEVAHEVNKEYKSGIMDPVRDVARHEKQAAIKKKIIRRH